MPQIRITCPGGPKAGVSNNAVCAQKLSCGIWELNLNADKEFCKNWKNIVEVNQQLPSRIRPATLGSIAHDYPTAPSPHHGKIVNRSLYYYYHYM